MSDSDSDSDTNIVLSEDEVYYTTLSELNTPMTAWRIADTQEPEMLSLSIFDNSYFHIPLNDIKENICNYYHNCIVICVSEGVGLCIYLVDMEEIELIQARTRIRIGESRVPELNQ